MQRPRFPHLQYVDLTQMDGFVASTGWKSDSCWSLADKMSLLLLGFEGYTPAAPVVPTAAHLRRALGIIQTAKKDRQFIVIGFPTPPFALCNTSLGTLFSLLTTPPPADPCVLGLGVGVMGNVGLCSHSAHGTRVPRLLPLHFGASEGVSKIVYPMWSCSRRQGLCCYLTR